jgi:hypothetical protein
MSSEQDEILARELGKVGALGGLLGGGVAGAAGGAVGASFAARFLPTERYQHQVTISQDAPTVLGKVAAFFASEGRIADEIEAGSSPYPKISGVLGSGFLKMNPALVHVEVVSVDDDSCTLFVSGAAKEGLIKQQSAQKAVHRVIEAIATKG